MTGRSCSLAKMQLVPLVALVAICAEPAAHAQIQDVTKAPPILESAGQFSAARFTGWIFVTPDGRYVVTEPLYVLDVREWKQYALFEALNITNYTNIEAISRDGRRLFISRRDGVIDCNDETVEYDELTLPYADRR